jgi:cytoskeletal protein CcmA (bactofilin family)
MWRKEDGNPQASPEVSPQSAGISSNTKTGTSATSTAGHKAPACISQGIKIKGEVTGTEDLFVDGRVDGKITIAQSAVTVGPNGVVKAEIVARELVFRGVAEGKFTAEERIQIWHTARVHGELKSQRISIEDGAELRGKVEAGSSSAKTSNANDATTRAKKTDQTKTTEATAKNVSATSDAAAAGAD